MTVALDAPSHAPALAFDPPLVACRLCGSARIAPYDRDWRGVEIWRCESCGVGFMNPQYTDAHLSAFYAGYIGDHERVESPARRARRRRAKEAHFGLIEEWVRPARDGLDRIAKPSRFFAIGFGDGLELEIARERGWEASGWDVDPETVERVGIRLGLPVYSGDLFALPLAERGFECVFMEQVIEHPKNPGDYLALARRLLAPGGILFLGTPNIGSVTARWKTALGRHGLRKRRRGNHYDTWHHLFYYTPDVLRRVLESRYDFEVLRVEGDPKPDEPAVSRWLQRRMPALDSSLRLVARAWR